MIPIDALPLADAFQGFIAVALLVISFISWIINVINSQNPKKGGAAPRRPAQRDKRIQDEIDMFLKGATSDDESKPRPARKNQDVEIVRERPEPAPRKTLAERRVATAAPPAKPKPPKPKPVQTRPASRALQQLPKKKAIRVGQTELGSKVSQHVSEHMRDRIDDQVALDLGGGTVGPLSLALDTGSQLGEQRVELTRQSIIAAMRNPHAVRQAIMINEILSPPLARRADR